MQKILKQKKKRIFIFMILGNLLIKKNVQKYN